MNEEVSTEKEQDANILAQVNEAVAANDSEQLESLFETLHPAEIAHCLEALPGNQREQLWPLIPAEHEGEVLLHLNDEARGALIEKMDAEALIAATESLDTDDLADILPEMPQNVIQELLLTMEFQDRERLRSVLAYPEDSAGGLMDLDTVMVRADITLDVVFRFLRRRGELPDTTDSLFVIDRDGVFKGILPFRALLTHDTEVTVAAIMDSDVEGIPADMSAHEVANLFERRDLVTAPVVDKENKLLGRITIDDVVDVIRDKADHSFMGMAGLNEEEDLFAPVIKSTRRRLIWLGVNLITAIMASWVIRQFDGTIDKLVALAVLMPIVASMGGIAGSQTLTLVIRAIALGQISSANARRLLFKEIGVGIWNGLIWAVVVAAIAEVWYQNLSLSIVIGTAIIVNLIVAAIAGATIPLFLKRLNIDPALSGSVVLTTITDVIGFFVFLGLAAVFLV
ncbi:MAG: magnesium transporter [Thioalkalispiraceae bacterium]|jgi:magnesium transporter